MNQVLDNITKKKLDFYSRDKWNRWMIAFCESVRHELMLWDLCCLPSFQFLSYIVNMGLGHDCFFSFLFFLTYHCSLMK